MSNLKIFVASKTRDIYKYKNLEPHTGLQPANKICKTDI